MGGSIGNDVKMEKKPEYKIRSSESRGSANHGWLQARHSFSFADYRDPKYDRFRMMRVLNEDRIAPKNGFPMHPHQDMEIVTYVLSGSLHHTDSMDHSAMILPGDAQRMSAGTGIIHSEMKNKTIGSGGLR